MAIGKGAHAFKIAVPMDHYEVEDAARTIKRHHEIKANKKLHRAAKRHLKQEKSRIDRALREK